MSEKLTKFSFATAFVDYILIFSQDIESHKTHLRQVLQHLQKEGVSISFKMSTFMKRQVKYLEKIISEQGVQADLSSLKDTNQIRRPRNKTELMRLLRTLNWFRDYLPGLSTILLSITDKLGGKTNKLEWIPKDEVAVDDIFIESKRNIYSITRTHPKDIHSKPMPATEE
jgi:hypothetical protein